MEKNMLFVKFDDISKKIVVICLEGNVYYNDWFICTFNQW